MADLRIFPDHEALSRAAADLVQQAATAAVNVRGRFLVVLSGGGTPGPLYRMLARPPYREQMPWTRTHVFWGDERLVAPDVEGSNYRQAQQLLLGRVPIPVANIHRAKGELTPAAATEDYANQLAAVAANGRSWPRFDLALMGMGSDGHTASLFPGAVPAAETSEPVITVTADYDGRPAHRVSLTPLVFNDARHVLFLVVGKEKAAALTAVLEGEHRPEQWPAQQIQPHDGELTWFVDTAAAHG